MGLRLVVVALLGVCGVFSDSEVVVEHELTTDGNVPGLGDVLPVGSAGATFVENEVEDLPPHAQQAVWEGDAQIDPTWNQAFLRRREEEKQRQLAEAIKLKQQAIQMHQQSELASAAEAERIAKELGESVVDPNTTETEVYDGYAPTGSDSDAAPSCEDNMNTQMTQPNTPPPPTIQPLYPQKSISPPTAEALKPVVTFTRDSQESEASLTVADLVAQAHNRDFPTSMPTHEFQHWMLESNVEPKPLTSLKHTPTARSGVEGGVMKAVKSTAAKILRQSFATPELENNENGMDFNTAWGVMNSNGAGDEIHTRLEREVPVQVHVTASPSPSPSPSQPPREIDTDSDGQSKPESEDPGFLGEESLASTFTMPEKSGLNEQEPALVFNQPQIKEMAFRGELPHPISLDTSSIAENLQGMGNDREGPTTTNSGAGSLVEMSATAMNNTPELQKLLLRTA